MMSGFVRFLVTTAVVLAAVGVVALKYRHYLANPWTRDGQVRAQVIQINPRVSGPIVHLPVKDNQLVKEGDLLFEIDPRTFEASLAQAKADLKIAQVKVSNARSEANRYRAARAQSPGSVSEQEMELKVDEVRAAEAAVLEAEATVEAARLDLEFTRVRAPVDGYVTNLNLRRGDQAVANQPALALVDIGSYWIHGFFRETVVGDIRKGDCAVVTLMSYPDHPLEGAVDSIGWGIAQSDGSAGEDLLPSISPTFEWIRLAQRVPVRIHLKEVPQEVELRVGTTASVLVMKGTAGSESCEPIVAAPRALQ
jgi:multidrug resistance efflux pump